MAQLSTKGPLSKEIMVYITTDKYPQKLTGICREEGDVRGFNFGSDKYGVKVLNDEKVKPLKTLYILIKRVEKYKYLKVFHSE